MTMRPEYAVLADEGIARVEAAIMRAVAGGMPLDEAIERHVEAVAAEWPLAMLVMTLRFAELGRAH